MEQEYLWVETIKLNTIIATYLKASPQICVGSTYKGIIYNLYNQGSDLIQYSVPWEYELTNKPLQFLMPLV